MYRSFHNPRMPATASTFHQRGATHPHVTNVDGKAEDKVVPDRFCRTFGKPPGSNQNTPRDFMRKGAHTEVVATLAEIKKKQPDLLKPTRMLQRTKGHITPRSEMPPPAPVVEKNFIVANAIEAILAQPRRLIDTSKDYIKKDDYGQVPKYLGQVKKDIEAEYEYISAMTREREDGARQQQMRTLDEDEKNELIAGLKAKWEALNTVYQGHTHLTTLDTIGKIKRKEQLEAALAQYEKDIQKLSKRNIMINQAY